MYRVDWSLVGEDVTMFGVYLRYKGYNICGYKIDYYSMEEVMGAMHFKSIPRQLKYFQALISIFCFPNTIIKQVKHSLFDQYI